MDQTNAALEQELTNDTIQRLIDGQDPLSVKANLEQHLDANLAEQVFQAALSRFHAARETGTLHELQHAAYFAKRPSVARRARSGVNVLILGVAASALSYYFAPPGAKFKIFVGIIALGAWLLISS
jgi:hypothetical protein